ncbi:MAG: hypothetical protein KY437_02775 [Actinobacteria bacterium]|nr:hypothetical protein [Actinomycetota bacterium]
MRRRTRDELLDHGRTVQRVRVLAVAVGGFASVGLLVSWLVAGGPPLDAFLLWAGLAVLVIVLGAIAVVTAAALRGMLRAGDRGERLADRDVGLVPPQLRSRDGRRER